MMGLPRLHLLAVTLLLALSGGLRAQEYQTLVCDIQSRHPYANNLYNEPTDVSVPGAGDFRLHFADIDLEDGWDYLRIHDGTGQLVEEITGTRSDYLSKPVKGDRATLLLTTDYSNTGRGFRIDRILWRPAAGPPPPPAQGGWVEEPRSVASPDPYPPNLMQERWDVTYPGAEKIKVFFDYVDVEDGYDWVQVFSKDPEQPGQNLTGKRERFWSMELNGDTAVVLLTSDYSTQGRGFRISRVAAYLSTGPATPQIASVAVTLWDGVGQEAPLPGTPIRLAPRGQSPDRIYLRVRAYDAAGREIPADAVGATLSVQGNIGTASVRSPGVLGFLAGGTSGRQGRLQVNVPGYAGSLPAVTVVVSATPLAQPPVSFRSYFLDGTTGELQPIGDGPILLHTRGGPRDRFVLSLQALDAAGRVVALPPGTQVRTRGPGSTLRVEARPDGTYEVIAGSRPVTGQRIEVLMPGVAQPTTYTVNVVSPPPPIAGLAAYLETGGRLTPLSGGSLELGWPGQPDSTAVVVVRGLDALRRAIPWSDAPVTARLAHAGSFQLDSLGDGRYQVTALVVGATGHIHVEDPAQQFHLGINLTSRTQVAAVRIYLQQPNNAWSEWTADTLLLSPQGMGSDTCTLEVRAYDLAGNQLPADVFTPQLAPVGRTSRAVVIRSLGGNRFQLTTRMREPMGNLALQLSGASISRTLPLQIARPQPVLTSLRVLRMEGARTADIAGTTVVVQLPRAGQPANLLLEIHPVDQMGQVMQGLVISPSFAFPGAAGPVGQFRMVSQAPSRWQYVPPAQPVPTVDVQISVAGSVAQASFKIQVEDPSLVKVGSQAPPRWVSRHHKYDYDFSLTAPALRKTESLRLQATADFRVEHIQLQTQAGQWITLPATKTTLKAGKPHVFQIAGQYPQPIQTVRVHGYYARTPARITLWVKDPTYR